MRGWDYHRSLNVDRVTSGYSRLAFSLQTTEFQRTRALDLLKARGMLRLKDFVAEGIGPETLARLVREGAVARPARGLYQLSDAQVEAAHTLAEAAALVPKGIVCLTSALQYHELTLQMPAAVWMAIERTAWRPKIDYPAIRFVRFTGDALTDGVVRHRIQGVAVPITDPARTIVDCFRYRAKVGLDVAMEGCERAFAVADARLTNSGAMHARRGSGR
jgi:predicted transcriptional regulator of viral defense system